MVDLIVEYEDGYDLISCKWWKDGLSLGEIGPFFALTNQHLPNLKNKYLLTTAPRHSSVAAEIAKAGKDVITLYEDDDTFIVDDDTFDKIKSFISEKIVLWIKKVINAIKEAMKKGFDAFAEFMGLKLQSVDAKETKDIGELLFQI
jgi:hypothetical protein